MLTGPVRVAVNQCVGACRAQPVSGGFGVHIGVHRAGLLARFALRAQALGNGFSLGQRLRQKSLLPRSTAYLLAKLQIVGVGQTQRIAMRQQPAPAGKVQNGGVIEQGGATALHQGLTDQKIPVAMHEKQGLALARQTHGLRALRFKTASAGCL